MKNKLLQPKIIILAVVGILIVAGLIGFQRYNQDKPYRAANTHFQAVFAEAPELSGAPVWSESKDDTVRPSSSLFSIEPHGGSVSRTLVKVATADTPTANQEYLKLSAYMENTRGLSRAEVIPGKKADFIQSASGGDIGLADVFVVSSVAELENIALLTQGDPALQARLEQHFTESNQPIYGYAMRATHALR